MIHTGVIKKERERMVKDPPLSLSLVLILRFCNRDGGLLPKYNPPCGFFSINVQCRNVLILI